MEATSVRHFAPIDLRPPEHGIQQYFTAPMKVMGPDDLSRALMLEVAPRSYEVRRAIALGIELAAYVHRDQRRGGGTTEKPYLAHPLRNALRLMRYGCRDVDVLTAALLHDTVEDGALDMMELRNGTRSSNTSVARRAALELIADLLSAECARIVDAVSNPPLPAGLSKPERNAAYLDHVRDVIRDPKVFLVKFSDWVDNGVGLIHTESLGMVSRLAPKYLPLCAMFEQQLAIHVDAGVLPVTGRGIDEMRTHLELGERRLSELSP